MFFLSADLHIGHRRIIEYCNRPFSDVHEMNKTLVSNHNYLVKQDDIVIHAGDFTLQGYNKFKEYLTFLNGRHIFVKGSHDIWAKKFNPSEIPNLHKELGQKVHDILELSINNRKIVVCHYAMRTWPHSHHGSILFYGHSHGKLKPFYNALDVGVDNNDYRPISLIEALNKIDISNFILETETFETT